MSSRTLSCRSLRLVCVAAIMSSSAVANQPAIELADTTDIALRDGGVFVGQVVDRHGNALEGESIALCFDGQCVARSVSDANGVVAIQGLRGGDYQLVTSLDVAPVRLWAVDTAPPTAHQAALIVPREEVVNGQSYPSTRRAGMVEWIRAHPGVVTATMLTAVIVPVAIADDDNS